MELDFVVVVVYVRRLSVKEIRNVSLVYRIIGLEAVYFFSLLAFLTLFSFFYSLALSKTLRYGIFYVLLGG